MAKLFARLLLIFISTAAFATDEYFGKYSSTVKAEWLPNQREMKILEDFEYEDPNGMRWIAPKGSLVDGASIPQWLWSVIGSPFAGLYRDASVIHDVACEEKNRTWEVVHLSFYYAMRASGVSKARANLMYGAVYHFGPRWPSKKIVAFGVSEMTMESLCTNVGADKLDCSQMPKMTIKKVSMSVDIPPSPSVLNENDVERFKRFIIENEDISLNEIREFR